MLALVAAGKTAAVHATRTIPRAVGRRVSEQIPQDVLALRQPFDVSSVRSLTQAPVTKPFKIRDIPQDPWTLFPTLERIKIPRISPTSRLRQYIPLDTNQVDRNRTFVHSLKTIQWGERAKGLPPAPTGLAEIPNVVMSRHIGNYYLVTIQTPQGRQRYRLSFGDQNDSTIKNANSVWYASCLLGESAHFRPTMTFWDPVLEQTAYMYRYVEGASWEALAAERGLYQYLPDSSAARLYTVTILLGLFDSYPRNLIQPLNPFIKDGYTFKQVQEPLPSIVTDQVQFIDYEDAWFKGNPPGYFRSSYLGSREESKKIGPDAHFYQYMEATADPFLRALIIKHEPYLEDYSPKSYKKMLDTLGDINIPRKIFDHLIVHWEQIALVLLLQGIATRSELESGFNFQHIARAAESHFKSHKTLTLKQFITGTFG